MNVNGVNFIKVGKAINTDKRVNGADFKIQNEYKEESGVVYLFLHNEDIVYIGVTQGTIKNRMAMYSSNTSGSTNIKMRKNLLLDGSYDIYMHIAEEVSIGDLKTTNELTVEKCLIQHIKPKYNKKI